MPSLAMQWRSPAVGPLCSNVSIVVEKLDLELGSTGAQIIRGPVSVGGVGGPSGENLHVCYQSHLSYYGLDTVKHNGRKSF